MAHHGADAVVYQESGQGQAQTQADQRDNGHPLLLGVLDALPRLVDFALADSPRVEVFRGHPLTDGGGEARGRRRPRRVGRERIDDWGGRRRLVTERISYRLGRARPHGTRRHGWTRRACGGLTPSIVSLHGVGKAATTVAPGATTSGIYVDEGGARESERGRRGRRGTVKETTRKLKKHQTNVSYCRERQM